MAEFKRKSAIAALATWLATRAVVVRAWTNVRSVRWHLRFRGSHQSKAARGCFVADSFEIAPAYL